MTGDGSLRCSKHGCEMKVALEADHRHLMPLRRCPQCCAEFREAVRKAKACFRRGTRLPSSCRSDSP